MPHKFSSLITKYLQPMTRPDHMFTQCKSSYTGRVLSLRTPCAVWLISPTYVVD